MGKINNTFTNQGYVVFEQKDTSTQAYKKLAKYFFGVDTLSDLSTIKTLEDSDESTPYGSRKELDVHSEGIGDPEKNIYGIFLTLQKKPLSGGESILVYTPDIVEKLPASYDDLYYEFEYNGMKNKEKLIFTHPVKNIKTLNFTTFGINREENTSKYISICGHSEEKSLEILMKLYDLVQENMSYIRLDEGQTVVFDNFLFLHGRSEYSGERIVDRLRYIYKVLVGKNLNLKIFL